MTRESQRSLTPDESDDDDFGLVIVSLNVFARSQLTELSAFERIDRTKEGGWWYDLGTISSDEADAGERAAALESAVTTLLELLSAVPEATLRDETSFVRLFITLGRGAQTLSPSLVQRIAAANATVWIDA